MNKFTVLVVLTSAILLAACGGTAEPSDSISAPLSCELLDSSPTEQIFKFADPDTSSPSAGLGTECASLGGGVFTCKPDACLALPFAGTCPHCAGGE